MAKTLSYLALGDSLTAGTGAPSGFGFTNYYRNEAEKKLGKSITLVNRGVNGARTSDVLHWITSDLQIQDEIRTASMITITAGGNDMLDAARNYLIDADPRGLKHTIQSCKAVYTEIFQHILQYKKDVKAPYFIRVLNLFNPFPQFSDTVFWIGRFNKMLMRFRRSNVDIVDIYSIFLGKESALLSDDGIHPNQEGYRIMAEQVLRSGFKGLRQ